MLNALKTIIRDFTYVFANYFIANIPCWHIRKILYQIMGMKIGKGSRICMKCIVMSPWKISIGDNTMINEYVLLDGRGGLKIGNNSSISMWAVIYTASHYSWSNCFQYFSKSTTVGDCCWIGTRAIVMPGSYIADRSIISANSIFKGITEVTDIFCGVPAIKVATRQIHKNYELKCQNYFK